MVKSETTGVNIDDLDKMFDVTEEKKKNMASFKGKQMLKMPAVGDKKGIIIRPLWSKDDNGNPAPIVIVKSDSPKMKSADGTMKLMTVETQDDPGIEYTIPYGSSLHYSFVGIVESHHWKFEDVFGKWFKLTADEYENKKAPSGKAIGYRVVLREDLNTVVNLKASSAVSQF